VAPPVTTFLAEWVAHLSPEAVPASVRKEAIRSLVNWVGVTVGGSQQDAVALTVKTLAAFPSKAGVSLFARREKLDPLRAALVSGISSHVLDFDDTDLRTIIHPAATVAASLFALCQVRRMTGAEFLHAFILGVEIECRIGRSIYPSHYDMGWHITATCGAFGAAVACGKAMKLDPHQLEMALGIAATEASGLKINFGSMSKSFGVGRGAENGLFAAMLAANGFTSAERSLEGKDGYFQAASLQRDFNALTEGLGQHFEISYNTYKPFACGIVIHPAIDAILQIRAGHSIKPSDVRNIVVRANPLVLSLTGKKEPRTGLEGKFSVYHSVAVALVRGYAGPAEYSTEAVKDPQVARIRELIKVIPDASIRSDEAYVTVATNDQRSVEIHVEHALGSLERPLTDTELDTKYRELTKDILPQPKLEELLSKTWSLEAAKDAAELPRLGALSL
jgi:2-methylcitrate dehydratase PrpD